MGIDTAAAQLILLAKNYPDFDPTHGLIFGHQKNYIGPRFKRTIGKNLPSTKNALAHEYADEFFDAVGFGKFDVLDISDYENANIIQDLNLKLPSSLKRYSLVVDIGTLEHVFNINQGLENIKDLCLPGGYVLMLNPANNWLGHGFYQFSPELLFRTFEESHGWEVKAMYIVKKSLFRIAWYDVIDPKLNARRGNLNSKVPTYVGVIARKKESIFSAVAPQQSDYIVAWESQSPSRLGSLYLGIPKSLRLVLDVTLMAALTRYRGRLTRRKIGWQNGQLELR